MNYETLLPGKLHNKAHVGKVSWYELDFADEVSASVIPGKFIWFGCEAVSIVLAYVSAYTILIFTGIITATIRPGDIIEFNSRNYTAMQNGANIVYLYSGDWIFITPELVDITLATSNAQMTGEIVYTEQFI